MRHPILFHVTAAALVLGAAPLQAAEEPYPAAHFEPQVIYQAENLATDSNPTQVDPGNYPAAYFIPQVIYQDPQLIETIGPQPVETVAEGPSAKPVQEASPQTSRKPDRPAGTVSDVSPPYGLLTLVLAVIGLAFWWSQRPQPVTETVRQENAEEETESVDRQEADETTDDDGDEEEDLESLAEEIETNLAHTNRQRANKTRRTRRR